MELQGSEGVDAKGSRRCAQRDWQMSPEEGVLR